MSEYDLRWLVKYLDSEEFKKKLRRVVDGGLRNFLHEHGVDENYRGSAIKRISGQVYGLLKVDLPQQIRRMATAADRETARGSGALWPVHADEGPDRKARDAKASTTAGMANQPVAMPPSIDFTQIPLELEGKWVVIRARSNPQQILGVGDTPLEAMKNSGAKPSDETIVMTKVLPPGPIF